MQDPGRLLSGCAVGAVQLSYWRLARGLLGVGRKKPLRSGLPVSKGPMGRMDRLRHKLEPRSRVAPITLSSLLETDQHKLQLRRVLMNVACDVRFWVTVVGSERGR